MKQHVQSVETILKYTLGTVPMVAGLDKFTNLLTDWSSYLAPWMENLLPMSGDGFMMIVGIIEIITGILVWTKTRLGAYVVAAWLLAIALSLLTSGRYLDVAVRDIVMAIAAYCLARLSDASDNSIHNGSTL